MNNIFRGFYMPKEKEIQEMWGNEKTLFIFDTNTILNLYRCEEQTKDDILSIMRQLGNKSWLPFQVYLEYQRNRIKVISQSISSLDALKKSMQSSINMTDNALSKSQVRKNLNTNLSNELSALKLSLSTQVEDFITNHLTPRIEAKKNLSAHDSIRKEIDNIIGNNHGHSPTQDEITKINAEGKERYENNIPPGYMDAKNKEGLRYFFDGVEFKGEYGDLYLWKEIINKSKELKDYNIIFITDDSKKDWWYIHDDQTIGPSEYLQTEIYQNTEIASFRILTQSNFLYEANKYIKGSKIKESTVKEIENITMENQRVAESRLYLLNNISSKSVELNDINIENDYAVTLSRSEALALINNHRENAAMLSERLNSSYAIFTKKNKKNSYMESISNSLTNSFSLAKQQLSELKLELSAFDARFFSENSQDISTQLYRSLKKIENHLNSAANHIYDISFYMSAFKVNR